MDNFIIFNDKYLTEEQKDELLNACKLHTDKLNSIYVVYTAECECPFLHEILLDRFPMPKALWIDCPVCKRLKIGYISDPIQFFHKLTNFTFGLKDLLEGEIQESRQKEFLLSYKELAKKT